MTLTAETKPMLRWCTEPIDRAWLAAEGYARLEFPELRARFVTPASAVGMRRTTLAAPAAPLLERYAAHDRVAVIDFVLHSLDDLRDLYAFVLEPAWRCGVRLIVQADRTLNDLDSATMVDPGYDYPWTLERARYLAAVMGAADRPLADPGPPDPSRPLDAEQLSAVAAHDGVVQVIAPAGSGKTTVLVERVRELLRRGTSPERILCATFNRDAASELRDRLAAAGVGAVEARTFHSIGLKILRDERLLSGRLHTFSPGQWRRLCAMTQRETGHWFDPPDASSLISGLKLSELVTASEWAHRAPGDEASLALVRLYELYEDQQRRDGLHDFDDYIMRAVRALRSDGQLRARWQQRFARVLVDEYQDIEPAQELLVQILAAPQDSLFAVGDEDQVLYAWRRARVERIVALDQTYPGLQRVALATNYRCDPAIVERSAQLIAVNQVRFPKTIRAKPDRETNPEAIKLDEHSSAEHAAAWAAQALVASKRGEIVVLARTTRLLRGVAEACIAPGVRISAPEQIFEARGAQGVLEAHLRLASAPATADVDDVALVMRHPSRGLPSDVEQQVALRLRDGATWAQAVHGLADRRGKLADAAATFGMLRDVDDARMFVRLLRTAGGLDRHFEEYQRTFGGAEQVEIEQLEDAERAAAGQTVAQYAAAVAQRRDALLAIRDDDHGIELTTVHRAKGREWPAVIVVGFDTGQLPHRRALEVTAEQRRAGEGMEAERRVAYVALTRAKDRLHVLTTKGNLSPFAWQAGLAEPPPQRTHSGPTGASRPLTRRTGPPAGPPGSEHVVKTGAKYALRVAPSRRAGMRIAAWAIRHNLVTADTAAGHVHARDYLAEIPDIPDAEVDAMLAAAGVQPHELVRRLSPRPRRMLADVLDSRA